MPRTEPTGFTVPRTEPTGSTAAGRTIPAVAQEAFAFLERLIAALPLNGHHSCPGGAR